MSRLTRSEIETLIDDLILAHPIYTPQLRALREQSLSQEAAREEVLVALEEAVDYALDVWMDRQFPYEQRTYVDGTFAEAMTELGKQRTALKREPNAAEEGQPRFNYAETLEYAKRMKLPTEFPAPAAPDVAEMVKRLRSWAYAHPGNVPEDGSLLMEEAAALLARLGQGCKEAEGYRLGYFDGVAGRRPAYPLLPPAPGASDE